MSTQLRDEDWHNRLVDEYWNRVVRLIASKLAGDMSTAEDLAQETFQTAWTRRSIVPDTALPWLIKTAQFHMLNYNRKRRHAVPLDSIDPVDLAASAELSQVDDRSIIESSMRDLSESDRHILELAYVDGLNSEEIAMALQINTATARKRLARARERVQNLLKARENIRRARG